MSECCDDFGAANEEAYFRLPRTACSSREIVARIVLVVGVHPRSEHMGAWVPNPRTGEASASTACQPDKLQLAETASQEDSQTSDRRLTCAAGVSQESTAGSSHHHSGGKKKVKKTHKKKKSSK